MSDFLSGFSDKNNSDKTIKQKSKKVSEKKVDGLEDSVAHKVLPETKEELKEVVETQLAHKPEGNINESVEIVDEVMSPSTADPIVDDKSTDIEQEQTYLRDEPTEFDPEFKKNRDKKRILIGIGIGIALVLAGVGYYFTSTVKLPDFKNQTISEVRSWASDNRIEIETETVFSNDVEQNVILEQSTDSGKRVKKGSSLKLTMSKGSDPDEVLGLMSFEGSNESMIREWMQKNHIENLKITKEYSETISKGDFIKITLNDDSLNPEDFKRKDAGTIVVSNGTESFEKTIVVPDFKDKTKGDVETFRTTNKFKSPFIYVDVYSDKTPEGMVVSQSVSKDEKVGIDEILTIEISKGKALVVPDYSGTNKDSFVTVDAGGVNASAAEWYSTSVPFGSFVSQSIEPGTNVTESPGLSVIVRYSVGKPFISGLVGQKEGDLAAYFYNFNSKGTDLTYVIQHRSSCEPKGVVMEASHDEEFVGMSEKIWVTISSGASGCAPAGQ